MKVNAQTLYCYAKEKVYTDCSNSEYVKEYNKIVNGMEITSVDKSISEVVLEKFPQLELGSNGCKTNISGSNYTYLDGCYLSGTQESNYIWYSGFMWRIMGINSNGSIRMITQENETSIYWASNSTSNSYASSYAKAWLNYYYFPKLKTPEIVVNSSYCQGAATATASSNTTCTGTLSNDKIGLISIDEVVLAGFAESYLISMQQFWTTTRYNTGLWVITTGGSTAHHHTLAYDGLRPIININPATNVNSGQGSVVDPYILNDVKTNVSNKKLSEVTLSSGEYIKFSNKIYRVVSSNSTSTKLILDGYYEEPVGTKYRIQIGATPNFNTTSGIGLKLNTDVLNWLVPSDNQVNRDKLIEGLWYQTMYSESSPSYTASLSETGTSVNAIVGLIRVGEILSGGSETILTKYHTMPSNFGNGAYTWMLTKNSSTSTWINTISSIMSYGNTADASIRPVIYVKSSVNISGGNGTPSYPYKI